jgi:lipopolysaccharide biosynthesis regulator YciM
LALQTIRRKGLDLDAIEESCRDILLNRFRTEEQFQHALRLAEAIRKTEPQSRRSRILIGAAQMRCGHTEQAVVTLEERPNDPLASDKERIALLLLCEMQRGASAKRQGQLWGKIAGRSSRFFLAEATLQMELSTQVWITGAIFLQEAAKPGFVTVAKPLFHRFFPVP